MPLTEPLARHIKIFRILGMKNKNEAGRTIRGDLIRELGRARLSPISNLCKFQITLIALRNGHYVFKFSSLNLMQSAGTVDRLMLDHFCRGKTIHIVD